MNWATGSVSHILAKKKFSFNNRPYPTTVQLPCISAATQDDKKCFRLMLSQTIIRTIIVYEFPK